MSISIVYVGRISKIDRYIFELPRHLEEMNVTIVGAVTLTIICLFLLVFWHMGQGSNSKLQDSEQGHAAIRAQSIN